MTMGRQIAAARTLLGLGQAELAERSSISVPTLKRMEASDGPAAGLVNNVAAVRRALEDLGIEFVEENGGGPGVRLGAYSIRVSRARGSEQGVVKSLRHFVRKADAIAVARDWLEAAKKNGEEVRYNPRQRLWWTAVDGKRSDQTLILGGPIGGVENDLNLELNIASEEE
jgi:transcriptional regulator with XRE-family HTH domain